MIIIKDFVQGSDEWLKARCGIPTASHFDEIVTMKGEMSKQSKKYLYRLAGERITGAKEESYNNATMQAGVEREPEARALYAMMNDDAVVEQVGLCYSDDKKFACSPDGLVGEDGGLEIKCPLVATHIGYLLNGELPSDYFQQVQGCLFVTGRKWWDFMSYSPGLKPFIIRVKRDEGFISLLKGSLITFCKELDEITERIR